MLTAAKFRTPLAAPAAMTATSLGKKGDAPMAECLLCGDSELSHEETSPGSRFLGACRTRILVRPPNTLLPEGHYETCDCPGFEPATEDHDD